MISPVDPAAHPLLSRPQKKEGAALLRLRAELARHLQSLTRLKERKLKDDARQKTDKEASVQLRKAFRLQTQGINRQKEESRRLFQRLLSSQDEERKRMSQDLNDEVAQTLAAIHVQLAALKSASAADSESFRKRITRIHSLIGHSAQVIDRYARELQPAMLSDIGLIPALRAHLRDHSKQGRVAITLNANAGVEILSKKRRTVVYRIVQETLARILELRGRLSVSIILIRNTSLIHLSISVRPGPLAVREGTAMKTALLMAGERIEMIGGRSRSTDQLEENEILHAEIPLRAPLSRNLT